MRRRAATALAMKGAAEVAKCATKDVRRSNRRSIEESAHKLAEAEAAVAAATEVRAWASEEAGEAKTARKTRIGLHMNRRGKGADVEAIVRHRLLAALHLLPAAARTLCFARALRAAAATAVWRAVEHEHSVQRQRHWTTRVSTPLQLLAQSQPSRPICASSDSPSASQRRCLSQLLPTGDAPELRMGDTPELEAAVRSL